MFDHTNFTGYDLGGSEYPINNMSTVVDIKRPKNRGIEFIKRDLREDFSDLPPKSEVYVGRMMRYLEDEHGSTIPLGSMGKKFADRLDAILSPGGEIAIFDFLTVASVTIDELIKKGYIVQELTLVNYDESGPSEYVVSLRKPS